MAQVKQLAVLLGWRVYHTHDSRRSDSGFPDLFLVKGATAIAAELKVGKRKATLEQTEWLAALSATPVRTFLWRPEDWAQLQAVLEGRL